VSVTVRGNHANSCGAAGYGSMLQFVAGCFTTGPVVLNTNVAADPNVQS